MSNKAIRTLTNLPLFFVQPKLFSARHGFESFQPLLSTIFALDHFTQSTPIAVLFQIQNLVWFLLTVAAFYLMLRNLPGSGHYAGLFGATLLAVHPMATSAVNYASQLGIVIGMGMLFLAMATGVAWRPGVLPQRINLGAPKVPTNAWDAFRSELQPKLNVAYSEWQKNPPPFHLIPLVIGLLIWPDVAIFGAIFAIYLILFEPKRRKAGKVAGALCGIYWAAVTAWTYAMSADMRIHGLKFFGVQPLVFLRTLRLLLMPAGMDPVSTLSPRDSTVLTAIAGLGVFTVLVGTALYLGHQKRAKPIAFGLWWFLIAMTPTLIVPRTDIESFTRMYFALPGLLVAVSCLPAFIASRLPGGEPGRPLQGAALVAAVAVVGLSAAETIVLNQAWESDETLWQTVIEKNPNNGRAQLNFGLAELSSDDSDFFNIRVDLAYDYIRRAARLQPDDAETQTALGLVQEQKVEPDQAEKAYLKAQHLDPDYVPAKAYYGRFLLRRGRTREALTMEQQAVESDPTSAVAWLTLADAWRDRPDWEKALDAAHRLLALDPDNEDGQRIQRVAETGIGARKAAEEAVKRLPTLDAYLALAAVYYNEHRYQDCINASREAIKLDSSAGEPWVNIGTSLSALGRHEESIAAMEEAQKLRPDLEFIRNNILWEIEHKDAPAKGDGR